MSKPSLGLADEHGLVWEWQRKWRFSFYRWDHGWELRLGPLLVAWDLKY